ncbi:MAG: glycosyltransferase family 4 protein [Anaerolineaceae bacterium]|nr:glycosyltransferase family 4 protein [Anaerolineaceae bacterium]
MNIAYFTNTYFPVVSGVVQCIHTFRRSLSKQSHNVFIFAQNARDYDDNDPSVFRYPAFSLPTQPNYPITIPFSSRVSGMLPTLNLDVIHTHHPFLLGTTAARHAARLNVPLVFTFHTRYQEYSHYVPLNQKWVKVVIKAYLANFMQRCHHIIVPSNSIKAQLAADYGITRQITAIPMGLDRSLWAMADGEVVREARGWGNDTVLISVGRLAQEKNWPTLLKAAAPILKTRPGTRLVLIGDGVERNALEKLAQALGIADRVEFTGVLDHSQVIAHLKAADLFCFASVTETQGLVTLEAMAAGLPVVAVNATGTRDAVTHEREGLLTDNNELALTQAICRVLDNPALRSRLAGAALKQAQSFDAEEQARKMASVYHQARQDQRAGRFVQVTYSKSRRRDYALPLSVGG